MKFYYGFSNEYSANYIFNTTKNTKVFNLDGSEVFKSASNSYALGKDNDFYVELSGIGDYVLSVNVITESIYNNTAINHSSTQDKILKFNCPHSGDYNISVICKHQNQHSILNNKIDIYRINDGIDLIIGNSLEKNKLYYVAVAAGNCTDFDITIEINSEQLAVMQQVDVDSGTIFKLVSEFDDLINVIKDNNNIEYLICNSKLEVLSNNNLVKGSIYYILINNGAGKFRYTDQIKNLAKDIDNICDIGYSTYKLTINESLDYRISLKNSGVGINNYFKLYDSNFQLLTSESVGSGNYKEILTQLESGIYYLSISNASINQKIKYTNRYFDISINEQIIKDTAQSRTLEFKLQINYSSRYKINTSNCNIVIEDNGTSVNIVNNNANLISGKSYIVKLIGASENILKAEFQFVANPVNTIYMNNENIAMQVNELYRLSLNYAGIFDIITNGNIDALKVLSQNLNNNLITNNAFICENSEYFITSSLLQQSINLSLPRICDMAFFGGNKLSFQAGASQLFVINIQNVSILNVRINNSNIGMGLRHTVAGGNVLSGNNLYFYAGNTNKMFIEVTNLTNEIISNVELSVKNCAQQNLNLKKVEISQSMTSAQDYFIFNCYSSGAYTINCLANNNCNIKVYDESGELNVYAGKYTMTNNKKYVISHGETDNSHTIKISLTPEVKALNQINNVAIENNAISVFRLNKENLNDFILGNLSENIILYLYRSKGAIEFLDNVPQNSFDSISPKNLISFSESVGSSVTDYYIVVHNYNVANSNAIEFYLGKDIDAENINYSVSYNGVTQRSGNLLNLSELIINSVEEVNLYLNDADFLKLYNIAFSSANSSVMKTPLQGQNFVKFSVSNNIVYNVSSNFNIVFTNGNINKNFSFITKFMSTKVESVEVLYNGTNIYNNTITVDSTRVLSLDYIFKNKNGNTLDKKFVVYNLIQIEGIIINQNVITFDSSKDIYDKSFTIKLNIKNVENNDFVEKDIFIVEIRTVKSFTLTSAYDFNSFNLSNLSSTSSVKFNVNSSNSIIANNKTFNFPSSIKYVEFTSDSGQTIYNFMLKFSSVVVIKFRNISLVGYENAIESSAKTTIIFTGTNLIIGGEKKFNPSIDKNSIINTIGHSAIKKFDSSIVDMIVLDGLTIVMGGTGMRGANGVDAAAQTAVQGKAAVGVAGNKGYNGAMSSKWTVF